MKRLLCGTCRSKVVRYPTHRRGMLYCEKCDKMIHCESSGVIPAPRISQSLDARVERGEVAKATAKRDKEKKWFWNWTIDGVDGLWDSRSLWLWTKNQEDGPIPGFPDAYVAARRWKGRWRLWEFVRIKPKEEK
jgi:hypothetical protein